MNNYWFFYYFVSRLEIFTEVYDLNTTIFYFEIMFDICYGFVFQHSYQIYLNVVSLSLFIDLQESIL